MKRFTSLLLLFSFVAMPLARAEEPIMDDDIFYTEEDDELFNRGKFVGIESNDYLRARRRERNKNWAIAIGSTVIGVATLFLVNENHDK